jgi:hypothetical protein
MIKTRPGGMSRLAVIIAIRSLEESPQCLGENDEHYAGEEPEPGAESKLAFEIEMRAMRDDEV